MRHPGPHRLALVIRSCNAWSRSCKGTGKADGRGYSRRDCRDRFLSKLVYQTYNGYAMSQFKKLGQDLRNRGKIKWKHAMHLIRLLLAGIRVLTEGTVIVPVEDAHRDRLMDIRDGEMTWDQIDAWRTKLHQEFELAYKQSSLPDRPDYQTANRFLIQARKQMVFQ